MDYSEFCKEVCIQANGLSAYPVSLYRGEELIFQVERVHLPGNANLANSYFAELYKEEQSVSYRIFEDCLLFALIRADDGLSLLLGPACVTDFTESIVRKIARFIGAGPSGQDAVREYLAYAPVLPFNFIAQIIGFLYLVLNREFYSPMDFFSTVPAADEGGGTAAATEEIFRHNENNQMDDTQRHTSFDYENTMLYYIQNGQVKNLLKFFRNTTLGRVGTVAQTALRQEKNNTISAVTLASRAAIAGGLSHEVAFQLCDVTIQKLELCSSIQQVDELDTQFMLEITERVAALQSAHCRNPLTRRAIKYVCDHVYDRITVEEMANSFHANRSFLSATFKKEIGYSLNEYINRQKIIEAKKLLQFTDKSLSEIANILTFSSQSHFQNTFKKIKGLTPAEYKKNKK